MLLTVVLSLSLTVYGVRTADQTFLNQCLSEHNAHRAQHQVGPLKLDPTLNAYAQKWADTMAKDENMHHSSGNYGENIMMWSAEADCKKAVDMWYGEVKGYNYNNKQMDWARGHFTQVVWKGTTKLGCGKGKGKSGSTYISCSYDPPGNYDGQFTTNVFPPK